MFLPLLSLSRILPAVMLSSGIWNLLTYNNSLDASGGRLSQPAWCGGGCFDSRRRVKSTVGLLIW
jgi:hypothetical protein